jgi:ketosteroid isomerase-like protein
MPVEDRTAIEEVLSVEREWVEAIKSHDLQAMQRILSEDYTQILPDGTVIGKQAALESYQSERRYWEYAESLDHQIRIYGSTAVMIARWESIGENHGVKFDYQARFMAVYVNNSGRWQLAADLSIPIPGKKASSTS